MRGKYYCKPENTGILQKGRKLLYVCTGHSGMHAYSGKIYAHIDQSAVFGKRRPFHKDGEYNPFKKEAKIFIRKTEEQDDFNI